MKNCEELKERGLFVEAIEGGLGGDGTNAAKEHISECPQCRDEFTAMDSIMNEFKAELSTGVPDPGAEFWQGLAGNVKKELNTYKAAVHQISAAQNIVEGTTVRRRTTHASTAYRRSRSNNSNVSEASSNKGNTGGSRYLRSLIPMAAALVLVFAVLYGAPSFKPGTNNTPINTNVASTGSPDIISAFNDDYAYDVVHELDEPIDAEAYKNLSELDSKELGEAYLKLASL